MTKIETNEKGEKVITLQYPFEWGEGNTVSEITIPRIRAAHMRGINGKKLDDGDMDEVLKLIQKLLGQPSKFVDSIDMVDVQAIGTVLSDFFPNGPTSGKTS